jgi:hypothetical protein
MASHRNKSFLIVVALVACVSAPIVSQKKLIAQDTARQCGCTLRKWPLLSEFLNKTAPSVVSLQPDTVLPHYTDAGCGTTPKIPEGGIYGEVRYGALAGLDLFIDHDWHDFNFHVRLNGDAYYLNSDANSKNENSFLCYNQNDKTCRSIRGETLMEIEWDTRHYPERFWSSAGDIVWMTGRYIWDCGHPDAYHSEIHAPKAIALTRLEPYVFAGDDSPSLTNRTFVYIHGKSGVKNYNFKTIEGIESVVFDGYKDAAVANRDYEFDIPLPAKPAGYTGQAIAQVIDLPFGGPTPQLTIDSTQGVVHVKYPLNLRDTSPDRKFGAVIVGGWRAPVAAVRFRKLVVHLESIQILKPHNVVRLSDWKLWINVNGQWTKIEGLPESESSITGAISSILDVAGISKKSGPTMIDKDFEVILPETDDARLTVQVSGWVNFYDSLFRVREDFLRTATRIPTGLPQTLSQLTTSEGQIGLFFKQFSLRDNFGIGSHNRRESNYAGELSRGYESISGEKNSGVPGNFNETQGDFAIAYTIREARRW